MRALPLLLLVGACGSIDGSVTIDGEPVGLDSCERISAHEVIIATDGDLKIRLEDERIVEEELYWPDTVSIGTGECLVQSDPICQRYDWLTFGSCTKIDITESTSDQGDKLVGVAARMNCWREGRTLVGTIEATNCL